MHNTKFFRLISVLHEKTLILWKVNVSCENSTYRFIHFQIVREMKSIIKSNACYQRMKPEQQIGRLRYSHGTRLQKLDMSKKPQSQKKNKIKASTKLLETHQAKSKKISARLAVPKLTPLEHTKVDEKFLKYDVIIPTINTTEASDSDASSETGSDNTHDEDLNRNIRKRNSSSSSQTLNLSPVDFFKSTSDNLVLSYDPLHKTVCEDSFTYLTSSVISPFASSKRNSNNIGSRSCSDRQKDCLKINEDLRRKSWSNEISAKNDQSGLKFYNTEKYPRAKNQKIFLKPLQTQTKLSPINVRHQSRSPFFELKHGKNSDIKKDAGNLKLRRLSRTPRQLKQLTNEEELDLLSGRYRASSLLGHDSSDDEFDYEALNAELRQCRYLRLNETKHQ